MGQILIERQIDRLKDAGVTEFVINHFYLGQMIEERLGDGSALGVKIIYSREPIQLETAGGIINPCPNFRTKVSLW